MSEEQTFTLPEEAKSLLESCHQASVDNGWWHDVDTGEPLKRNKGELLCLVHSEISEAYDALHSNNSLDDKLPHRLGEEVELADALIRIADYAGGFNYNFIPLIMNKYYYSQIMPYSMIHSQVSKVMEKERKNNPSADKELVEVAVMIIENCYWCGHDLWGALREKLEFNAKRSDHKPENRRKFGGKSW